MNGLKLTAVFLLLTRFLAAESIVIHNQVQSRDHDFRLVQVAGNIPNPWSLAFLPDGGFLVTQRSGKLWLFDAEGENRLEITGLPEVRASGQGGLLDVVLHPDYEHTGWIYLSHVVSTSTGNSTAVSRGKLSGSRLTLVERIFTANRGGSTGRHFGSRIVFDDPGFLYISLGERGEMYRAQNRFDDAGSIVRLKDDGSIPVDNPFGDKIFTYGHRNPQGMIFDPVTGMVWAHEHGAKGGDEVNILKSGYNYGWPEITYGTDYDGSRIGSGTAAPGMVQPEIYWDPSIAPSGMAVYTGDLFPAWKGDIFVGALAGSHLRRLLRNGAGEITGQEVLLKGRIGRIRDVRQGPEGALYLLTDESHGGIYRIEQN